MMHVYGLELCRCDGCLWLVPCAQLCPISASYTLPPLQLTSSELLQGSHKRGKPGIVGEFCKPGKVREFEIWSGNFL